VIKIVGTKKWRYWNKIPAKLKELEQLPQKDRKKKLQEIEQSIENEFSKEGKFRMERLKELESIDLDKVSETIMDYLKESLFAYVNGQYLISIAGTGIVAERLAIEILESAIINGKKITKEQIEKFGEIKQYQRLRLLFTMGLINDSLFGKLDQIRKKRINL